MTLTPLNAIRERAEKATKEQLVAALMLALDQRDAYFADLVDVGIITTKGGKRFRAQDDATLAAILEPNELPRTNEKGDHERD